MNKVEDHYIKDSPVDGCRCSWCQAARQDDDRCEDCGGRYILGSHMCFGPPPDRPIIGERMNP